MPVPVPVDGSNDAARRVEVLHTIFGTRKPPLQAIPAGSARATVMTNPRVAIIDDEPINTKLVRRFLMLAGYRQFFTTSESSEAMELIRSSQPDVVLLDIMMPGVSGLDILQQLRADEQFVDLPVIVLTASSSQETKVEALRLGVTEFLGKPFDPTELVVRLRNVLRVKTHQDWFKHYTWELESEIAARTTELVEAHLEIIECLAKAGECRDTDTGNHVLRVGCYAGIIARHMHLPPEFAERIRLAAPLHDIGKLGIPDSILHKPGPLDERETEIMKRHSQFGKDLCDNTFNQAGSFFASQTLGARIVAKASSPVLEMAASIAYSHHERWDGTGYPRGLAGEDIPIEGRITALADVFDALCSRRPYKPPISVEQSLEIIRQRRATHFDPAVVDTFFDGLEEILAAQREFSDEGQPGDCRGDSLSADTQSIALPDETMHLCGSDGREIPPPPMINR